MTERHPKYPLCPPLAPQVSRGGFLRTTGRALVGLSSWRITGELPNVPKLIMLAAPHSSNWDGIYGILGACAIGLKATWMGKASLFKKPILGRLMHLFGGIAVDRSNPAGAVGQVTEEFAKRERMWVVLAPEGTRKKVHKWRTGFWHLARAANVPLFLVYFDYQRKEVGCGELFHTTDNLEADMERLYAFYAPWRGKGGKNALPATKNPADYGFPDPLQERQ
jgi:1-acyl-sn-glycerol-3-phosphate acyltransferase